MPKVKVRFRGARPEVDVQLGLGIRPRVERARARLRPRRASEELLEVRELTRLLHSPAAPPAEPAAVGADRLRVAFLIPAFHPNSVHHQLVADLTRGLEKRGHEVAVWIDDEYGDPRRRHPRSARRFKGQFGPFAAEVRWGTRGWTGADVAIATSWRSLYRLRLLTGCRARLYLAQDDEVDLYATSYQREWAERALGLGMPVIAIGDWLAEMMRERHRAPASSFEAGVDRSAYRPIAKVRRRDDVVLFCGEDRGALPVLLAAMRELKLRRPQTELWSFRDNGALPIDVPIRHMGAVPLATLPELYSSATVGVRLSVTNLAPVALEMAACGLAPVELETPSAIASFGRDGPAELATLDPLAIAAATARLLDDGALRRRRLDQAAELVVQRTWDRAAQDVEHSLHAALRSPRAIR